MILYVLINVLKKDLFFKCVCVCVCVCVGVCVCVQLPEELNSSGTGVTHKSLLSGMDAENQTWVLCKLLHTLNC